jgi:hypothetical protein
MSETNHPIEWHTAADREALLAKWKADIEAERVNLAACDRLPLDRVSAQITASIGALAQVARELDELAAYDQRLMQGLVAVRDGTPSIEATPLE